MLYIFDADGTLCDRESGELLPGVESKLRSLTDHNLAIATNQGGVGLREWMLMDGFGDPYKYPSMGQIIERYEIGIAYRFGMKFYACYAYQTKAGKWAKVPEPLRKRPEWSQAWRKPAPGMLLRAMADVGAAPADTIMVGDSDDDRQAAENAGVNFILAREFFGEKSHGSNYNQA